MVCGNPCARCVGLSLPYKLRFPMDEPNSGFSALTNTELVAKATLIAYSLSRNPGLEYFPNPEPAVVEVEAATKSLSDAIGSENSAAITALRAKYRDELIVVLKKLAVYVALKADGDVVMLAASGFDLRKKASRTGELPGMPVDFMVKHTGISGEVRGRCKPVPNASSYEVESSLSPDGPWTRGGIFTSSQKLMFTGLTRGKDYFFRVRAITAPGSGAWSDIASIMVI